MTLPRWKIWAFCIGSVFTLLVVSGLVGDILKFDVDFFQGYFTALIITYFRYGVKSVKE